MGQVTVKVGNIMDKQAKTNYKTVKVMETEEVKFNQKMDELAA